MNQASLSVTEQLQLQLISCLEKLQSLQQTTVRKEWDKLEAHINAYQNEITALQRITDTFTTIPQTFADDFKHLSYQQRRVMRAIDENMQVTSEDIDSVGRGISRLKRIAEISKPTK